MGKSTIICAALDPVPVGMRRYRVRGLVTGKKLQLLYILAASQADAEAAYVEHLELQEPDLKFVVGVTPN